MKRYNVDSFTLRYLINVGWRGAATTDCYIHLEPWKSSAEKVFIETRSIEENESTTDYGSHIAALVLGIGAEF